MCGTEQGTLREAGCQPDALVGTGFGPDQIDDPEISALATREFSSITPENELKWPYLQSTRGQFTFGRAESLLGVPGHADLAVGVACVEEPEQLRLAGLVETFVAADEQASTSIERVITGASVTEVSCCTRRRTSSRRVLASLITWNGPRPGSRQAARR